MAIRFLCASCRQPIEIDDEWASKLVACPFCRKTIMAPASSDLPEPDLVPTATPLQPAPSRETPGSWEHPNKVAIVAFALICLVVFQILGMAHVIGPHKQELKAFEARQKELREQGAGIFAASQEAMAVLSGSHNGSIPGWLITVSVLQIGMVGCWFGTVVCGMIGVRRRRNRRWALSSLFLAGLIPVLMLSAGAH